MSAFDGGNIDSSDIKAFLLMQKGFKELDKDTAKKLRSIADKKEENPFMKATFIMVEVFNLLEKSQLFPRTSNALTESIGDIADEMTEMLSDAGIDPNNFTIS